MDMKSWRGIVSNAIETRMLFSTHTTIKGDDREVWPIKRSCRINRVPADTERWSNIERAAPYPINPFAFAIASRNISGVSFPVFVLYREQW